MNSIVEDMEVIFCDDLPVTNKLPNSSDMLPGNVSNNTVRTEFQTLSSPCIPFTDHTEHPNNESTSSIPMNDSEITAAESTASSSFVHNELYYLLNSTLDGQILLKIFQKTKTLNYSRLKHIIIFNELKNDPIHYKIPGARLAVIAAEIKQLFRIEDVDLFYIPYEKECDESLSAKGSLYNYYKQVRKVLRIGGFLQEGFRKSTQLDGEVEGFDSSCICDVNQENYDLPMIIQSWEETFTESSAVLSRKEKKKKCLSLNKYFTSFPCLCPPYGILLLELDFQRMVEGFARNGLIPEDEVTTYASLFCTKWPALAEKVISQCKKSKVERKSSDEAGNFASDRTYGIQLPLRQSLKHFLKIPNMFNKISEYIEKLSQGSKIVSNLMQADLWKKKYASEFSKDNVLLPLFIFFDDLEVGNPLGSHSGINKFGAVYASLACLPPKIASRP